MRALICHSAKDLRIETTELPDMGPDQVRVKVAFGGICGSDLHYYQHGGFGTVRIKQPMALGHEISGVVSALGANVKHLKVGQRIAISPSRPCGSCRFPAARGSSAAPPRKLPICIGPRHSHIRGRYRCARPPRAGPWLLVVRDDARP